MSCVFVVIPVLTVSWPIITATIAAASSALGYRLMKGSEESVTVAPSISQCIDLEMPNSKVVMETLGRDESLVVGKDDLRVTFYRDARGGCSIHVDGENRSTAELEEAGRQLVNAVTQQYAYQKVMSEMKSRGFNVVNEEMDEDRTIRVKVRKF